MGQGPVLYSFSLDKRVSDVRNSGKFSDSFFFFHSIDLFIWLTTGPGSEKEYIKKKFGLFREFTLINICE